MRAAAIVLVLLVGCDAKEPDKKPAAPHAHLAPHGGLLVEVGEEFAHLELLHDASTGKLTGYVLDGEAEKSVRLDQKAIAIRLMTGLMELRAVGNPLTGESPGDTSQFEGQSNLLKGTTLSEGVVLALSIKGKTFDNLRFAAPKANSK